MPGTKTVNDDFIIRAMQRILNRDRNRMAQGARLRARPNPLRFPILRCVLRLTWDKTTHRLPSKKIGT